MDAESKQVIKVLAAMAKSQQSLFMTLWETFCERPNVKHVRRHLDVLPWGENYIYQWHVEVTLKNGKNIHWYLDVKWDEKKWIIEPFIEGYGDEFAESLKEFPERFAETLDEVLVQLKEATLELIASEGLIETQL